MLKDNKYNKINLLGRLSCICWFLEKYAIPDAENAKDTDCLKLFKEIKKGIDKYITELEKALECK